jgi:hypothetical protein
VLCMFGWIFRGRGTASATALFGPWPYSSFVGGAFAPCLIAAGRDFGCGWGRSSFVRYRRGSSSPSVVAAGSVSDLLHLLRLGMGRAQGEIAFLPQLPFRPDGGCPGEGPA